MKRITNSALLKISFSILLLTALFCPMVKGDWLKMDPPPDVDKSAHNHKGKPTCWLATAANLLAGAGYGSGTTVQMRADNLYNQLIVIHDPNKSGWADVAITNWLDSDYNLWPENPYVDVTVYGYKEAKVWAHDLKGSILKPSDDGAQFIGNQLRSCRPLGISINFGFTGGGHVFSAWGDNKDDPNQIATNPDQVIITDSDGMEYTGDTKTLKYTLGQTGWWLNYSNNTFIKHIVTLGPIDDPNDTEAVQITKAASSYRVCNTLSGPANGLHHTIGANPPILSYLTTIDRQTGNTPSIFEQSPRYHVCFAWDLSDNPVPVSSCVTVHDTLVLPYTSSTTIEIKTFNPFFYAPTPPDNPDTSSPDLILNLLSSELPGGSDYYEENITGGYVVGAFDLYGDPAGQQTISEHRFCIEYEYFQDPENHELVLISMNEEPKWSGNFRFGHSYGLLEENALWQFEEWTASDSRIGDLQTAGNSVNVPFSLPGLLPYPQGENYIPPIPQKCGDPGTEYLPQDFNYDCVVDLIDLAEFMRGWLICTDPQCLPY